MILYYNITSIILTRRRRIVNISDGHLWSQIGPSVDLHVETNYYYYYYYISSSISSNTIIIII